MLRLPLLFQLLLLALAAGAVPLSAAANTSGIVTTGTKVTVKDNGDGTVTMANGIVSILIETGENRINSIQYTSNNSGVPRRIETLMKNDSFRWGGFPLGGSTFVYSLAVDPTKNGGNYGDVMLLNTSDHKGVFELHYSMLRGVVGVLYNRHADPPCAGCGRRSRRVGCPDAGARWLRMDEPELDAQLFSRSGTSFCPRHGHSRFRARTNRSSQWWPCR